MKKLKEYLEWRRNYKIAKQEIAKCVTFMSPVVNEFIKHSSDVGEFIIRLTEASKDVKNDELLKLVLSEIAAILGKSEDRLMEIITYMASLSEEDIQKIIVHSVVESKSF